MCDATYAAYAALALTATKTYVDYQDGKASAKRQEAMINDAIAKDQAATRRQYEEINASAQDESQKRYTDYLVDAARLKAIGAESGLFGATQDRVEQEDQNNADADLATIESNRQRQTQQAATAALAKSTQAGVQLAGIRRPSALGAGLQIGAAGVSAYDTYKGHTDPTWRQPSNMETK